MTTMLLRLPPDPPEKWQVIQSALETTGKTLRLCLILLVGALPFVCVLAAVILTLTLMSH
jgi:hypothetical protein